MGKGICGERNWTSEKEEDGVFCGSVVVWVKIGYGLGERTKDGQDKRMHHE